jgi:hypothetical protein
MKRRRRWRLFSRLLCKALGHTLFVRLCQRHELLPLRMAELRLPYCIPFV